MSWYVRRGKRSLDVGVSALLLALLSPLLAVALAVSAWTTRANPVYVQRRVGRHRETFPLYKIRTMRPSPHAPTSTTTTATDARIAAGTRWMRSTKVDELPQLVNVLTGDMSLVGPRPTVPGEVARMGSDAEPRFSVRPGITGLSQVSGNTRLLWEERIELDRRYVQTLSLRTDLTILLRTVAAIATGRSDAPATDSEWATDEP
jgi:undecaprenyl phosphate N,N'-diacetylbacillosamine 1-phosphate transferase